MTPSDRYALAAVVLAALLTFATRLAPFVLFGSRARCPRRWNTWAGCCRLP